ncbi:hypothetical protein [Absidia glauca]|uniref:Uncharacterized protein n=1 Tax=Absidia glauca TaxID=4829 RepID=A0A163MRQ3_ABSGL|nr:hypothetical protein [Absidia glauca]
MNSALPHHSDPSINSKAPTSTSLPALPTTCKEEEEKLLVSWQKDMADFLTGIGLDETRRCFDTELLVLSRYHQSQLPHALENLVDQLLKALEQHVTTKEKFLANGSLPPSTAGTERTNGLLYAKKRKRNSGDDDKLHGDNEIDGNDDDNLSDSDYQDVAKRMDPEQVQIRASDSQVQQRINTYIQAKQSDVDISNRTEFLNRPDPKGEDVTCARADAREINRNIQMKFDVVNNEDGPLARSLVPTAPEKQQHQQQQSIYTIGNGENNNCQKNQVATQAMEERLGNLESHLNVQFERHSIRPFTWMERISILETTLMDIEKKYPTWAAVHFNQPNRTYPPPPPVTLITRPLPSPSPSPSPSAKSTNDKPASVDFLSSQIIPQEQQSNPTLKLVGRSKSSLTRAVLEQLERRKQLQSSSSNQS